MPRRGGAAGGAPFVEPAGAPCPTAARLARPCRQGGRVVDFADHKQRHDNPDGARRHSPWTFCQASRQHSAQAASAVSERPEAAAAAMALVAPASTMPVVLSAVTL